MESKEVILRLEDVSAAYGTNTVLNDVSFELEANSFLGIAGPNGGGKTTLIKLILGLLKPVQGKISFFRNGEVCDGLHMGYLPQQTTFDHSFPITVMDVVLSGTLGHHPQLRNYNAEDKEKAVQLLGKVELGENVHTLIGELSGGQRQRALLARALMCEPEILVLDEPNTYFDIKARSWMLRELKELQSKCAVIMVSHDLRDLFEVTDKIAYIHHHIHLYQTSSISLLQLEEDILNRQCMH